MTDLFAFVFSVGGVIVALLIGALGMIVRPQSAYPRRFLIAVALAYTIASTYAIDHWFLRALASGFHPFTASDSPAGSTAIVVMGSGSFTARDWDNNEYSMPDAGAASRVLEAARVYRLVNPDFVISSGGKTDPDQAWIPTAVAMHEALMELGVPESRIVLQETSRNTHEEAVANAEICHTRNIQHIIVVTSDFHMRRTVGAYRAIGVTVIPAPARDPLQARRWFEKWIPSELGLFNTSLAAHEVLGLGYYITRGWYSFN